MCVEITKKIWKLDLNAYSPLVKFVLIKLGDHADEYGVCWPSVGLMANETGICERSVQSSLKTLEKLGYITRKFRGKRSTVYRLIIPGFVLPKEERRAVEMRPKLTPHAIRNSPAQDAPRTTIEPPINLPYPPQSGGNASMRQERKNRRSYGTNPRSTGNSPCQRGLSPRQVGTSPRQKCAAENDYSYFWAGIDWAPRLRSFYERDIWVSEWGDRPDSKRCGIPAEIISAYRANTTIA